MTREERKIIKKIKEIETYIEMDKALGRKSAPEEFYASFEDKIMALKEQLSYISHGSDRVQDRSSKMRSLCLDAALLLYDAFMVNLAYLLAILIRFSDSDSYKKLGRMYMGRFREFAPWYTLICLLLFIIFRLYGGVWRYAGINDIKKLMLINTFTSVAYICGSLFVVKRMPITVYIVGASLQFIFMCVPRLAPRYIWDYYADMKGETNDNADIPLMIVGIGENARIIQNRIERDRTSRMNPVCILDHTSAFGGRTFNGLPVFCGPYAVYECIRKYDIRCVMLADRDIPEDLLMSIRRICEKKDIEIRGFVIDSSTDADHIGLREFLKTTEGPVSMISEGEEARRFERGEDALEVYDDKAMVNHVGVVNGVLQVTIESSTSEWEAVDE